MKIDFILCPEHIEDKIEAKHGVTCREARQALLNQPRIRFVEKGHVKGENVYAALGPSYGGRYPAVFFVYKPANKTAIVISARELSNKERKGYGRKKS